MLKGKKAGIGFHSDLRNTALVSGLEGFNTNMTYFMFKWRKRWICIADTKFDMKLATKCLEVLGQLGNWGPVFIRPYNEITQGHLQLLFFCQSDFSQLLNKKQTDSV